MDDKVFWSIIKASKQSLSNHQEHQLKALNIGLSELLEDELVGFNRTYLAYLDKAYTWDLWAAAYIINEGCSDDCFDYFRDWLISQGEIVYNNALENPETLILIAKPSDTGFEEFRYIMSEVYQKRFAKEMPDIESAQVVEVQGEEWDEDDLANKYPKLTEWIKSSAPENLSLGNN
jgi:hypothetical protein